ncbi:hypothetical protein BMWSH_2977 [Priestia megaterium WSH-002]|uniref:Uncharacterized protein n=1 Tax=Priestia megaterium (strain WSH-002) TaxID=1006007 RepID=A0A8D4BPM0_PRIMW|nr:hypothetical protein BMWSH_2977 [Priestia megaterium WSH-002]
MLFLQDDRLYISAFFLQKSALAQKFAAKKLKACIKNEIET